MRRARRPSRDASHVTTGGGPDSTAAALRYFGVYRRHRGKGDHYVHVRRSVSPPRQIQIPQILLQNVNTIKKCTCDDDKS